ncbi:unnamed protein product [Fraxinus pennsylvanica]|uniref:Uncharacterized protein n=1 Tax=Fraxinus pennsylvanica TaxID=56036 RepID=A0AAD2E6K9_9LAMI|nr:unnamed protein product [Fraxinus pennsylvanica]
MCAIVSIPLAFNSQAFSTNPGRFFWEQVGVNILGTAKRIAFIGNQFGHIDCFNLIGRVEKEDDMENDIDEDIGREAYGGWEGRYGHSAEFVSFPLRILFTMGSWCTWENLGVKGMEDGMRIMKLA